MNNKIDPIARLQTIRREAWIVKANNGWGDMRAALLASTIYELCVEVVGKEFNDKSSERENYARKEC